MVLNNFQNYVEFLKIGGQPSYSEVKGVFEVQFEEATKCLPTTKRMKKMAIEVACSCSSGSLGANGDSVALVGCGGACLVLVLLWAGVDMFLVDGGLKYKTLTVSLQQV